MGWDSERLSNSPEVTKLVKVALGEYEAPGSHLCPPPRPQCKTGKKRVRRLGALKGRLREISLKSKHQSLWGLERTDQHGCEASRSGTALASVFTLPVTRSSPPPKPTQPILQLRLEVKWTQPLCNSGLFIELFSWGFLRQLSVLPRCL